MGGCCLLQAQLEPENPEGSVTRMPFNNLAQQAGIVHNFVRARRADPIARLRIQIITPSPERGDRLSE